MNVFNTRSTTPLATQGTPLTGGAKPDKLDGVNPIISGISRSMAATPMAAIRSSLKENIVHLRELTSSMTGLNETKPKEPENHQRNSVKHAKSNDGSFDRHTLFNMKNIVLCNDNDSAGVRDLPPVSDDFGSEETISTIEKYYGKS